MISKRIPVIVALSSMLAALAVVATPDQAAYDTICSYPSARLLGGLIFLLQLQCRRERGLRRYTGLHRSIVIWEFLEQADVFEDDEINIQDIPAFIEILLSNRVEPLR